MLIVVCGLPGTGKSTVANVIAKKVKGIVVNTDVIRKKLFLRPTYERWEKALVYKVMFLVADYLLKIKRVCILDAVFPRKSQRKTAKEIAEKNNTKIYFVECVCNEDVIKERMKRRFKRKEVSDANFEIYLKLKKEWEPIKFKHFIVDTTHGSREAAKLLLKHFKFS